ncbi:MAG: Uncharacterised protein [Flavobacterium sp. SCGC AAA160-P02]|nr:MAG: Uncharacterised protein [Flavobacterium sp. SCGC AAA160-P02]
MKNLFIYYFAILLPIPLIIIISDNKPISFTVMLLFYIVFRGFIDGQRLIEKKLIKKSDLWKCVLIPFWSSRFFRQLYFEK